MMPAMPASTRESRATPREWAVVKCDFASTICAMISANSLQLIQVYREPPRGAPHVSHVLGDKIRIEDKPERF